MKIPDFVLADIPKGPQDNSYFYHAEDAWERMTEVQDGITKYRYDDYSALINTLERYYKCFLQSKLDNIPEYTLPEDFLTKDHDLKALVDEIEDNFMPLTAPMTKNQKQERRQFLFSLRREYTQAKYTSYPTHSEFCELYKFVEKQRALILQTLEADKKKQTNNVELDNADMKYK